MIHIGPYTYTIEEAEDVVRSLTEKIAAERERLERPVRVSYLGGNGGLWTYSDPSGTVEIGDTVEVDARGTIKLGRVEKLGRGIGAPSTLKPILAVYRKDVL